MEYICECGKCFEQPAQFNGHKRNCFVHLEACGKLEKLQEYKDRQRLGAIKAGEKRAEKSRIKKEEQLEQWISEQHTCERCGKVMTEKYGSGRFCCKSCANGLGKVKTEQEKQKIRDGIKRSYTCFCEYCSKEFDTLLQKRNHEVRCLLNPNRKDTSGNNSWAHQNKLKRLYKINSKESLNVTYGFIENYMNEHQRCEICGRTIEESINSESKYKAKKLCVDHDHKTSEFRGVLCPLCNRQLGWYENKREAINNYLDREYPKE